MKKLLVLFTLFIAFGQAQIANPPEVLLEFLEQYNIIAYQEQSYIDPAGFRFSLETRNGFLYRINGEGEVKESSVPLIADILAQGTGYGQNIFDAALGYINDQLPQLYGRGVVVVRIQSYFWLIEVTDNDPLTVSFSLSLDLPEAYLPTSEHSLGPSDAKYIIREFSDFQCPACRSFFESTLGYVKSTLLERGDVRFEYHHFPLVSIHPNAAPAAEAAECVAATNGELGFWLFHDALFTTQQAWSTLGDPYPYFIRLAADNDLETEGMQACLDNRDYAEKVRASYELAGGQLGLSGTPTLLINGFQVSNWSTAESFNQTFAIVDLFSLEQAETEE